jgi:tetratricopeptide (TPR) repeat protein
MADDDDDFRSGGSGDSAAVGLALNGEPSTAAEARAYLREQTKLARLQSQNLVEQNAFELSHLKWRRFGDQMRGVLYIFGVLVALAIVIGFGAFVWNAARSDGLVIEAFSVPPDFVSRGLTGEVVAGKVLDRLQAFQAQTQSNRAASSYANNWGDDIKVQIPETGVSVGQLNRYLRQWLGHETEISGEVYRTTTGIAVAARAGGSQSPTFSGSEADLDKLIEKAAESVYRATQPYRYAVYLSQHDRDKESRAVYQQLIADGPPLERGWAYIGLAADLQQNGKPGQAIAVVRRAIAEQPALLLAYINLSNYEGNLQHDDASLAPLQEFVAHANAGDSSMGKADLAYNLITARHGIATSLGDYSEALSVVREGLNDPDRGGSHETLLVNIVADCGALHDVACVRRSYAGLPPSDSANVLVNRIGTLQIAYASLHDWRGIVALQPRETALLKSLGAPGEFFIRELEDPILGLAESELGNFPAAEAILAACPADGDVCMRARGDLRANERKWGAADYWFSRAVRDSPRTPFGYEAWGEALLKHGDFDGAIAQFDEAHGVARHFADPLEYWGEALMLKNRSDLALAKFEEADKYAPNWKRLRQKWGEALGYLGRKEEGAKQLAIARALDG